MTNRADIERQIRELLVAETRSPFLSNKLFGQSAGLFCQLASDAEERKVLSATELFRVARARVHELQRRDADALRKAMSTV